MPDQDIYRGYNFKLMIGSLELGAFTQVTGLEITIEPIAFREGGANWSGIRKLPGRVDIGEVTLKYGLTRNTELWDWVTKLAEGNVDQRNVSIVLIDTDGTSVLTRWNLINAWISAWRGAKLDAMGQQAAIEEITLVAEKLTRGKGGDEG
ncbi:MAG: phage tail protein [Thiohalocapsa sp.]